jgi:hypothetical protein
MALKKLGLKCSCCGERETLFLNFDHINGGGKRERKERDRRRIYKAIIRGERDDIRLLCFNCNLGRELNGGICPHQGRPLFYTPGERRRNEHNEALHTAALDKLVLP